MNASRIYPGARAVCPPCRGIGEILAWKPDLIHSQCEFSSFLIAKWIGEKLRIPIVHTYHTVYEDYTHYFSAGRPWGKQAAALFSRFILERTDRVIVPTKKVAGLLAGYGVDRPMEVIPTGIRTERFVPIRSGSGAKEQQAERSRIRQSLGIGEEKTVLLALGRLAKEKNLEELITFFGRLDEPGMELVIAGDGPERKALEALAGQQKGRERIHFAGMIPFEETPAWYRAADLFVCASRSETQGITYLEALSAGLPVICRKDECVEGIVMDGLNGCVYENWMDFLCAAVCSRRIREGGTCSARGPYGRGWSTVHSGSERGCFRRMGKRSEKERPGGEKTGNGYRGRFLHRPGSGIRDGRLFKPSFFCKIRLFSLAIIEHMYYNDKRTNVRQCRADSGDREEGNYGLQDR